MMTMSWKRSEMRVTTNANLILLSNVYYTNSSLLVYLHKVCHNEEKEIRTRHNNQQQHTILIPSRDGRTVTIQTTAYPIEHTECGHYWLTHRT